MAGLSDRAYLASPIWIQQAMVAAYGWWWYRRRYGAPFGRLAAEFKSRERWNREQFRAYQNQQLAKVLAAARRSRYYGEALPDEALRPDMPPLEALPGLPMLDKATLRSRPKDLLTRHPVPQGTAVFQSSGTTGTPTDIYYPHDFHAMHSAVRVTRSLDWAGVGRRDRRIMFGVRKVCRFDQKSPPFWRFSPAENMAYASIYHLSVGFLPHYLRFLRSFRPGNVMGYPSALHTIARYVLDHNDLPEPAKAVFTTSETVTTQAREAIETAWRCRVYDHYGAVEGCVFASQCEHGSYHVSPEVGIVEIVDDGGRPCPPGALGEVVCTGLQNLLQPLIRYRIGDVAGWAVEQDCPCGRSMPILEGVLGRVEDMCYTPDGRQMLRFDTVFKGVANIEEAQVVQEGISSFVIYVVASQGFNERDVERLKHNMRFHVGDAETRVKAIPAIPRTSSGKFRAVVCNLGPEQRRGLERSGT